MFRPSQWVIFKPWNYKSNTKVIGFTSTCRDPFGIVYNQAYAWRKPYDFYNTFIIPRLEDDPLRGSKHVA
jgi:hypothetical protein